MPWSNKTLIPLRSSNLKIARCISSHSSVPFPSSSLPRHPRSHQPPPFPPVNELELRPSRLPEQEVREASLPRGTDDEVDGRAVRRRVHAVVDEVRADVGREEVAGGYRGLDRGQGLSPLLGGPESTHGFQSTHLRGRLFVTIILGAARL